MLVLRFQTATGRARPIDQMGDDVLSCLFWRQVRQGQDRRQQFSNVGGRECRQYLDFQLIQQFRITRISLRPLQFCLSDKPQRRGRERQVMFPRSIFLGHEFVPADFSFGILKGALGKVAPTTPLNQLCLGVSAGAFSSVYEQSPFVSRRITNHSGCDCLSFTTVQTGRTAKSASTHPRSEWRTRTVCHSV